MRLVQVPLPVVQPVHPRLVGGEPGQQRGPAGRAAAHLHSPVMSVTALQHGTEVRAWVKAAALESSWSRWGVATPWWPRPDICTQDNFRQE